MATVLGQSSYAERRTGERRRVIAPPPARGVAFEGLKISWGGIWAGILATLGSLILLGALGVAIGISALDPGTADPNKLATIAAVWGAVSLLVSLFAGGMVATRLGMIYDRATGMLEGVLVWIASLLLMAAFAGSGMGLLPEISFDLSSSRAAAWIGLGAMLLSLLAAVTGAIAGRRRAARRAGRE